jgi:hypothetical protein
MTWRRLDWAQLARRRDEWERFANLMSFVAWSGFSGKWIDPNTINPLYEAPPESAEARKVRTTMGFDTLEAGLRLMVDRQMGL